MHPLLFSLLLLLLPSPISSSSQTTINPSPSPFLNLTIDYGRIIFKPPREALHPKTLEDISNLIKSLSSSTEKNNNLTVAPRGAGHSTYGQAQAPDGVVIDMTSLPGAIQVGKTSDGIDYVDAGGGALWVDVLKETLKRGLSPRSWTDYLYLTVGGTLSVGGISGQAFRYGPQICNVLELDVITGRGEHLTCSKDENPDLFYGALGGFGQLGIITRARIILKPAVQMAKRVVVSYEDFDNFVRDQELLVSAGEVDYLEGFVVFRDRHSSLSADMPTRLSVNSQNKSRVSDVYYTIEMAIYYDKEETAQQMLGRILSQLKMEKGSRIDTTNLTYFDFLNRVRAEEEELRRKGLWEVAHPWLNLFVPRVNIRRFKDLLLSTIGHDFAGPIIVYPTLRNKWDQKMSAVIPQDGAEDDIFYVVSLLRAAPPSCTSGTPCLDAMLSKNQKMISITTAEPSSGRPPAAPSSSTMAARSSLEDDVDGMGAKQYLPYYQNEMEWSVHFGEGWTRFKELKQKFDPLNILTPGQRIFQRA